ncbi:MAG: hypothetical protein LBD29_11525 [Treponema sp.]|jgi:tetratricopeptide (TPR) repeat protein|nr:hypothetical protein [Treponema sp.]
MAIPIPKLKQKEPLKKPSILLIGALGLVLALLAGGGVYFFAFHKRNAGSAGDGEAFYRELADFDGLLVKSESFEKPETLNRRLDRLERNALSVESHLSILKRRRLLARQDSRFVLPYQKAAQEAAEAIPSSEALAAIAAEAILLNQPVLEEETKAKIRRYSARLSEPNLKPLALGLYIILGDLRDSAKAETIPNKKTLFSAVVPETRTSNTGSLNLDLVINLLLLQIMQNDTAGASIQINNLLHNPRLVSEHPELVQLGAEFFYDFGSPLQGAELFAQFSDERSIARQADALWLSGYPSGARNLWNLLLSPEQSGPGDSDSSPAISARSLYNLAATTENLGEKRANLYKFLEEFSGVTDNNDQSYYIFGTIYYTRLLDRTQSIEILEKEQTLRHPLLDLELLRRRGETWTLDKTIAETWLLVNRYADDPRIYQWACYFFDLQRRHEETAQLITEAGYRRVTGPWIDFHDSLRLIREGQLEAAEQQLKAIVQPAFIWQVTANIGRILEIQRDPGAALEYYEIAAALVKEKKSAAKIQFRKSHCFRALHQEQESRNALEQSIQLDPEYLSASLEIQRAPQQ